MTPVLQLVAMILLQRMGLDTRTGKPFLRNAMLPRYLNLTYGLAVAFSSVGVSCTPFQVECLCPRMAKTTLRQLSDWGSAVGPDNSDSKTTNIYEA